MKLKSKNKYVEYIEGAKKIIYFIPIPWRQDFLNYHQLVL